jgi:hypothetical protein
LTRAEGLESRQAEPGRFVLDEQPADLELSGEGGELGQRSGEEVPVTEEELIVEFALTRLDNPGLDLEEVAGLVVRRVGPERMLEFAGQTLAHRDELRGALFPAAVEYVLRVVLTLRGPRD